MREAHVAARLRRGWNAATVRAAEAAGQVLRSVPAAGGILLSCYGLWLAWEPLGFIAGGVFLLLLDRKVP